MEPLIVIPTAPLDHAAVERFRGQPFDEMIKFVIDIDREIIALGGEMHADAEALLLQQGSGQESLWGGNLHAWHDPPSIEFTSLINIRPSSGNRSMVVEDVGVRQQMERVLRRWVVGRW
jgi:hypothetical protein